MTGRDYADHVGVADGRGLGVMSLGKMRILIVCNAE